MLLRVRVRKHLELLTKCYQRFSITLKCFNHDWHFFLKCQLWFREYVALRLCFCSPNGMTRGRWCKEVTTILSGCAGEPSKFSTCQLSQPTLRATSTLQPQAATTADSKSLCRATPSPYRLTAQGINLRGSY